MRNGIFKHTLKDYFLDLLMTPVFYSLLGHMLNNEFIPKPFKKRLKSAAVYGRNNSNKCNKYFCHYVDNNWDYTSVYPEEINKVASTVPKYKNHAPPKISRPHPSKKPTSVHQPGWVLNCLGILMIQTTVVKKKNRKEKYFFIRIIFIAAFDLCFNLRKGQTAQCSILKVTET